MTITIKFRDSDARVAHVFLKSRYQSRASFDKLAKVAIREIVAEQARAELDDAERERGNEAARERLAAGKIA